MQRKAFTLLEIIIVIIIIGVLASLALPRLFKVIEGSRVAEAMSAFATIRSAVERCYLMKNGTYGGCVISDLDIENPEKAPNSHFRYRTMSLSPTGYCAEAIRNTLDGGDGSSKIVMSYGTISCKIKATGGMHIDFFFPSALRWSASPKYKGFIPSS